ncbi:MAG: phosphomannomutase [Nitriliruptoraceae bacterium]
MPVSFDVLHAIVKAYDIRGLVATQLDEELAEAIGAAAAVVLGEGEGAIAVGYDMRPSSEPLVAAFARGANAQGVDVVNIGLASTDMLYYASGSLGLPGAMFTASHNPAAYNGIKLCRAGAAPVSLETGLAEIRDLVLAGGPGPVSGPAGTVHHRALLADFADHVRSFVDVTRLSPVSLVVDAGNGMAGYVLPAVFEPLPMQVEEMYFELDGTFPNHPADPIDPANIVDLCAAVVAGGHALGLAFDGDADRMFAVDEKGVPVSSSVIGAVVADRLLRRTPGATVLHNLICSDVVAETITAAGGIPIRTRVGHSLIKQRMAETDAIYACEHSGHHYFRDNYRADSGLIAALVLLEAVAESGAPLSEVVAPYDRYAASGERNHRVSDVAAATAAVAHAFGDRATASDTEDGLTLRLEGGWFNLRPSNTEPLLRLNVEGLDVDRMLAIRDEVEDIITGVGV